MKHDELYKAICEIAAINDFPPPPGDYPAIKRTWKRMVTLARRAKEAADKKALSRHDRSP